VNKNKVLVFLLLALLAAIFILGKYYFSLSPKPATIPTKPPSETAKVQPSPTAKVEPIPFDYEIISISAGQAVLRGEKGEATLPNSPIVKVFKGTPPSSVPASFTDLSLGQKLRIERIAGQELRVYILQ